MSKHWCTDKHVFVFPYARDVEERVPEGYLCGCGEMMAHYEACPTCGNKKLTMVPSAPAKKDK